MSPRVSCPQLIGREAEMAVLRAASERVASGSPATVLVSGEAGVGKTRLVREFAERMRGDGVNVWSGNCAPLAEGLLPYAPVVDILRGVTADMGPRRLREMAGPAAADWLALLVPDLAAEPTARESLEAEQPRLFAAVLSLFERLGDDVTVLVVEDLHWADPSTCGILGSLIRGMRGRLMVVCTFRDDELPPSHPLRSVLAELGRGGVSRVSLRRLDRAETAAQVAGIQPGAPEQARTDRVFARSGGNPFLVEELLAAGPDNDGAPLPQGLRDILLTRVRRLPAPAERLLLAVALADRSADHALLSEVLGRSPEGELPGVRAAVEGHVLLVDGDRYVYRHALVAEAVVAEALPGERIALHRAFAEALAARLGAAAARVPAAALAVAYAEVAHHWFAAGDADRALVAAVDAGLAAESACALVEARGHFERALGLWWKAPEACDLAAVDLVGLYQHAAQTAYLTGDLPDALDLIRQAIAHAGGPQDRTRAGILHERLGRYLMFSASAEPATIAAYEMAVRLVPDTATQARARVLAGLAGALMLATRYRESRRWGEQALRTARRVGARSEESHALSTLGTDLTMLGDAEGGLAQLREALAIAEQVDNPDDLGRTHGLLAYSMLRVGRFTEVAEVAQRGVDSCRRHGTERTYGVILRSALLEALFWSGRWDEARHRLDEAQGPYHPVAHTYLWLAQAGFHTATGERDRAEHCLEAGRRMVVSGTFADLRGQLHLHLAVLHLWRGEPRAARDWVAAALAFLTRSDDGLLIARLLAAGARAEADLASARGSPEAEPTPLPELADLVAGLPGRLALGPFALAHHAVAEAEQSRALGGDTPGSWAVAASRWLRLGCPYPVGYARFRQAEALLATPNRRRPAARALAQAHAIAVDLGAAPLRAEVESLARRARLELPAETAPIGAPEWLAEVGLTRREEQVLDLLAQGSTNRQIAKSLFISQKTVNVHVSNILAKLDVPNRAAAAAAAHRQGLVAPAGRRRDET